MPLPDASPVEMLNGSFACDRRSHKGLLDGGAPDAACLLFPTAVSEPSGQDAAAVIVQANRAELILGLKG